MHLILRRMNPVCVLPAAPTFSKWCSHPASSAPAHPGRCLLTTLTLGHSATRHLTPSVCVLWQTTDCHRHAETARPDVFKATGFRTVSRRTSLRAGFAVKLIGGSSEVCCIGGVAVKGTVQCTHIQTYVHLYIHTYVLIYLYTYVHTYIHAYLHT